MHCKNRLEIIKFFNEMKTQDIIDLSILEYLLNYLYL